MKQYRASLTIEAALSLSLFILAVVVLMTPMLILNQQQNASWLMEKNARTLAKYRYLEYYAQKSGTVSLDAEALQAAEEALSIAAMLPSLSQPGMTHPDLLTESELTEDNICFVLNYDAALPFSILGLHSLPQQVVASRRPWIGAPGNRWDNEGDGEAADDPLVYVSVQRESDVFHLDPGCSYISHEFHSGSAAAVCQQQNKFGRTYKVCQSCYPSPSSPTVYYTEAGKCYHSSPSCRALQSYIQATHRSQALANGQHACIRCGGSS